MSENGADLGMLEKMEEYARLRSSYGMVAYKPYPKQEEFHALGLTHTERLFRAGNQVGKTYSAANEIAFHATGYYPDWWRGRRWNRPVRIWVLGRTAEFTRDNPQRLLLGETGKPGTGSLPEASIVSTTTARGTANAIDIALVKHKSGQPSEVKFKAYSDGVENLAGETLDIIWCDEEPPLAVYVELLARIAVRRGMIFTTATPLLGMSAVMMRFLMERADDRADINMQLDEAGHYDEATRAAMIARYPANERRARVTGAPALGEGAIFPVDEEFITVPRFEIPSWWPQICGIDFGSAHPTAGARIALDRDTDTAYLVQTYRRSRAVVEQHAIALKAWGDWQWAWPKDGLNETAAGPALASQYRKQGLKMLPEHATHEDGGVSLEAGIQDMLSRMESGRFKVFKGLDDWLSEFRLYHRAKGKVVPLNDDLLDASRYALMMLRKAKVKPTENRKPAAAYADNSGYDPLQFGNYNPMNH